MPLRFIYALFDELPETLCSQLIASRFHDELLLNRTAQLSLSLSLSLSLCSHRLGELLCFARCDILHYQSISNSP